MYANVRKKATHLLFDYWLLTSTITSISSSHHRRLCHPRFKLFCDPSAVIQNDWCKTLLSIGLLQTGSSLRSPSVSLKFSSSTPSFHPSCRISFFLCSFQPGLPRGALGVDFTCGGQVAQVLPAVGGKCQTLRGRSSPTCARLANTGCLRGGNTVIIEVHYPSFTVSYPTKELSGFPLQNLRWGEQMWPHIHQFTWRTSPLAIFQTLPLLDVCKDKL